MNTISASLKMSFTYCGIVAFWMASCFLVWSYYFLRGHHITTLMCMFSTTKISDAVLVFVYVSKLGVYNIN